MLPASTSWYGITEEWFVEEQGAFVVVVLVVEVLTRHHVQTFRRALALVTVLYGVRLVRKAHSRVLIYRLAYLRRRQDHTDQLG